MLLARELYERGFRTSVWSFPDYRTPVGRLLKAYLAGRLRHNYRTVHVLYAANRWEKVEELQDELQRGRNIIVNRYSPSNLAYGAAHGLPLEWLRSLENGLPKPDRVFVLDISPRTSFGRKSRRRDVHEGDRRYLARVRGIYLRLARKYGWKVVDGKRGRAAVHSELWRLISRSIRLKSDA